jgi:alpha-1,3-rhamnosyl/mannosyltransferase
VGTFKPHKNVGRLLAAWKQLQPSPSWQLVLAGIGSRRYPAPKEQVAHLGLTSSLRVLDSVPEAELPSLYSGASAFVFPSLYEGFGLPVLEAMACGTPVVCSRSSSLPEVVGDAAILFDPMNVSDIARSLDNLLADPARRDALALQGIARARLFTWSKTAEATLSVYESVVQ